LGSFQVVYADEALRAAQAADSAFATTGRIGPFHGIPFALKDIFEFKNQITTCGSIEQKNRRSTESGTIVRRLLAAGGILLGKTKTVESALGGWGTNQRMGTPLNPWDLNNPRVPGGSSSGSGVAVTAGLSVCATGTDTGGSIRLPAAFCGLTGLKVSKSCLPVDGIMPLSDTLDTPGPMTRSVTDTALMLAIMQGYKARIIDHDFQEKSGLFACLQADVSGLKLGVLDACERNHCSPDVLVAYDDAVRRLMALGVEIDVFTAPQRYSDLANANGALTIYEGYAHHKNLYEDPGRRVDEDVRKRMLTGRMMTNASHQQRLRTREKDMQQFNKVLTGFDALLTPTIISAAPLLSEIDQDVSPGHFTRPFNYLDMCALAMPTQPTPTGLPTSLQIVARASQEALTLRIGAALEATFGTPTRPNFNSILG
jgi:aspartyl-tRNA(Asn)/glutamyl-tRNA(Gln) amidotransferase subunit A